MTLKNRTIVKNIKKFYQKIYTLIIKKQNYLYLLVLTCDVIYYDTTGISPRERRVKKIINRLVII